MAGLHHDKVTLDPGLPATNSHRQLLARLDSDSPSSSDREGTTDEEIESSYSSQDFGEVGGILGVSISRAQTQMKSPATPATVKAQALESSRGYFTVDGSVEDSDKLTLTESPEQQAGPDGFGQGKETHPVSILSRRNSRRRSSLLKPLSSHTVHHKRSSTGGIGIIDSIRKVLTDFPSYPGFGSTLKHEDHDGREIKEAPEKEQEVSAERPSLLVARSRSYRTQSESRSERQITRTVDTDPNKTLLKTKTRPPNPRRTTSDNSLYLRKVITGASDFDDFSVYANVADMPNSRFKALTDSLADTSIKIPKMPSLILRHAQSGTNSETTRNNGASGAALFVESKSPSLPNPARCSEKAQGPAAAGKKHPILTDALRCATGDLVIMGGYRGSVLRSAEAPHHQVWVPIKVGFNLRKVDLEVGLTHEDEERMEEKIIPSGMLSHIGPIDISRRLLRKLNKCSNAQANQLRVHDYGYDWRLSPHLLSKRLIKYLEGLECNQPETAPERRGALVVAHSLGGLITRHAVNQRPELFSGVVYAGSPMNCCNILGPLRNGDDVLLSSRVLTAQVNFTLRTSYALLPEDGRCFLNKDTGERYDVDFFDVENWDKYHLSPCINPPLTPVTPQTRKSLVESITDSISSFTPSRPSRRSTWFTSSHAASSDTLSNSPPRDNKSRQGAKERAQEAKDNLESAVKSAGEHVPSPGQEAQDSLEPSMRPSASNKDHQKHSIATTVTISKDEAREYLARTLAEIKQFKAELAHKPAHQDANLYPPHAIIFGKSVPTVYGAKVKSREAIKYSDAYDDLAFASGDGVVLASAAQLPNGYRCVRGGRVETDRGHVGLLGDLEAVGQCITAVIEGRRRGIGMGRGK